MLREGVCVAVVVALALLGCGGSGEDYARGRVDEVLKELKPGGQREAALLMWNTGTQSVTGAPDAADSFEGWCRDGGFETIGEYQITEAVAEEGSNPPAVIVSGTIDGREFSVRVVKRKPIQWVHRPTGG